MMKTIAVCFAAAGMAVAGAATHRVTLYEESIVAGQALKPGDYKVEVEGGKAVISKGKQRVEAPVTVESAQDKFGATSVRYSNGDGKYRMREIRIGGTNTKLVFGGDAPVAAGSK